MSSDELHEARGEAIVFVLTTAALLAALGVTSPAAGWELACVRSWVWFVVCVPELVLAGVGFMSTQVPDYGINSRVGKILEIRQENPRPIHVVIVREAVGF